MASKIPRKPMDASASLDESDSRRLRTPAVHSESLSGARVQSQSLLLHGETTETTKTSNDQVVEVKDDKPDNKHLVSTWHVDILHPALMIGAFVAALLAAIGHLAFFLKLNRTHIEDYSAVSQGNVTTISNLIANIWSICLSTCLSIAFTQSFWTVVRNKYLPVAAVDKLYGLFRNILLARLGLARTAPILYMITLLAWALAILKTLPPGALTVNTTSFYNSTDAPIPSFNVSNPGSISSEGAYSFGSLGVMNWYGVLPSGSMFALGYIYGGPLVPSPLRRLVRAVLSNRELGETISPCGTNCSYTTQMEGPYLDCEKKRLPDMMPWSNDSSQVWAWTEVKQLKGPSFWNWYAAEYDLATMKILQHKQVSVPLVTSNDSVTVIWPQMRVETWYTTCRFASALYTVNVNYTNGLRNISYTAGSRSYLTLEKDCAPVTVAGTHWAMRCGGNATGVLSKNPTSPDAQSTLRSLKAYTLISRLAQEINGTASANCNFPVNLINFVNGTNDLSCEVPVDGNLSTRVFDTFFFDSFTNTSDSLGTWIPLTSFDITPSLLNEALFNITMTYVFSPLNPENMTVSVQRAYRLLTYEFSRPLNLILPYFIPLIFAIPVVLYTMFVMYYRNHVAAMEDSFIQILMTTTGSNAINRVAAGGCLGGENNVPDELKRLKVKYGDITGSASARLADRDDMGSIRRAGFGIEGEVEPLRRRALYGVHSSEDTTI